MASMKGTKTDTLCAVGQGQGQGVSTGDETRRSTWGSEEKKKDQGGGEDEDDWTHLGG